MCASAGRTRLQTTRGRRHPAGTAAGRQSADQVTVFDSVGFALEDYSTLRYVLAQAQRHGLGVEIDLVPATDDPKDLFRHIRAAPDAALGGGGGAAASAGSADETSRTPSRTGCCWIGSHGSYGVPSPSRARRRGPSTTTASTRPCSSCGRSRDWGTR